MRSSGKLIKLFFSASEGEYLDYGRLGLVDLLGCLPL